jgi:hypothetical protein
MGDPANTFVVPIGCFVKGQEVDDVDITGKNRIKGRVADVRDGNKVAILTLEEPAAS